MIRSFSWLLCAVFLSIPPTSAQEDEPPVQVYAIALAYRLDEAGTRHYNQLLRAIADEGANFNVFVRSLNRSLMSFKRDSNSCLFPATVHALVLNDKEMDAFKLVASESVDEVSLRVLTSTTQAIVSSIDEIEGKRIAILNGMHSAQFLGGVQADIETTPDEHVRLKMLNAGRLDAVLSFIPDILLAAEDLGLPVPHYDENLALLKNEGAGMICHDTASNRAFIEQFNKVLKEMKASGELQRILGKYAVIAP